MEILDRLREREFLFSTATARNKYRSIINSIESYRHIALASNGAESPEYRKEIKELYYRLDSTKASLVSNESYLRPYIYTGLEDSLKKVCKTISVSQPEAIFKLYNRFIVIRMELQKLQELLRS